MRHTVRNAIWFNLYKHNIICVWLFRTDVVTVYNDAKCPIVEKQFENSINYLEKKIIQHLSQSQSRCIPPRGLIFFIITFANRVI